MMMIIIRLIIQFTHRDTYWFIIPFLYWIVATLLCAKKRETTQHICLFCYQKSDPVPFLYSVGL